MSDTAVAEEGVSVVDFRNDTRIHIGLRTSDLDGAIRFYTLLLGAAPVKVKDDYAKWETDDPSVNLSLSAGGTGKAAGGVHYGVLVKSTAAVEAAKERFEKAGVSFHSEDETVCCYALQDKFWISDPDGNEWEFFVVLGDSESFHGGEESTCCQPEDDRETCC